MPKTQSNHTILAITKENLDVGTDQFELNFSYPPGEPKVGDVIVFEFPQDRSTNYIKRVKELVPLRTFIVITAACGSE